MQLFCFVWFSWTLTPAGPYLRHMHADRYEPTLRHEAAHLQPAKTTWKRFSSVSSCVRTSLIKTSSIGPEGPKAVRFHPGRRCWQVSVHIHRRWQQVRFITARHREKNGQRFKSSCMDGFQCIFWRNPSFGFSQYSQRGWATQISPVLMCF